MELRLQVIFLSFFVVTSVSMGGFKITIIEMKYNKLKIHNFFTFLK
jgi:hypothetical protein